MNLIFDACLNSGLLGPLTDLIYFFTSLAMSTNPVVSVYNIVFRVFRAVTTGCRAVDTALFWVFMLATKVLMAGSFTSVSFGV